MTQHVIDYYQDGFAAIPFCKNCSAEGAELSGKCYPLAPTRIIHFQGMTKTEFEEKYQKALDQSKPTVK